MSSSPRLSPVLAQRWAQGPQWGGDNHLPSILGQGAIGLGTMTYTDLGNDTLKEGSALSQVELVNSWKLQPG